MIVFKVFEVSDDEGEIMVVFGCVEEKVVLRFILCLFNLLLGRLLVFIKFLILVNLIVEDVKIVLLVGLIGVDCGMERKLVLVIVMLLKEIFVVEIDVVVSVL